jgi:hypothetical protein
VDTETSMQESNKKNGIGIILAKTNDMPMLCTVLYSTVLYCTCVFVFVFVFVFVCVCVCVCGMTAMQCHAMLCPAACEGAKAVCWLSSAPQRVLDTGYWILDTGYCRAGEVNGGRPGLEG